MTDAEMVETERHRDDGAWDFSGLGVECRLSGTLTVPSALSLSYILTSRLVFLFPLPQKVGRDKILRNGPQGQNKQQRQMLQAAHKLFLPQSR